MEKTKKFLAGVAVVFIAVVLGGGIIGTFALAIHHKIWPAWYTLPALVAFAWKPIVSLVKWLLDYAKS